MAEYIDGIVRHSVENPTVNAVQLYAPQLSCDQAAALLAKLRDGPGCRVYFYGPGTMFRGAYHRYVLMHPARGCPVLYRAGCGHLDRLTPTSSAASEIEQATTACRYAEEAFGLAGDNDNADGLLDNGAKAILHLEILGRKPMRIGAGMLVDFKTLASWKNEPFGESVDDVIVHSTLFKHETDEMSGDRQEFYAYFCGLCGGGMRGNVCGFCRHQYPAALARPITEFALPYRMASLAMLEYKHEFKYDPRLARIADYRTWIDKTMSLITEQVPGQEIGMGHERYLRIDH